MGDAHTRYLLEQEQLHTQKGWTVYIMTEI